MIFIKSYALAAAIVLSSDRLAKAKGLDRGLVKSIRDHQPIHQFYRRLLDDRVNPRAQRFLQGLSQECIDDLAARDAIDSDEITKNVGTIAFGPDCVQSKPRGCVSRIETAEAIFVTMDFTGVDFADPKYGLVAACEAEGLKIVQYPDFSGITCDSNGTVAILKGVSYQDCEPASCPGANYTGEDIAQTFGLTDSFADCVVGGPEPPKPSCESFCPDGVGENEDTPVTRNGGEVSMEFFGGDASEVLSCGWIHKNQANNAMFCGFESQCCAETKEESTASAMSIAIPLASILIIGKIIA